MLSLITGSDTYTPKPLEDILSQAQSVRYNGKGASLAKALNTAFQAEDALPLFKRDITDGANYRIQGLALARRLSESNFNDIAKDLVWHVFRQASAPDALGVCKLLLVRKFLVHLPKNPQLANLLERATSERNLDAVFKNLLGLYSIFTTEGLDFHTKHARFLTKALTPDMLEQAAVPIAAINAAKDVLTPVPSDKADNERIQSFFLLTKKLLQLSVDVTPIVDEAFKLTDSKIPLAQLANLLNAQDVLFEERKVLLDKINAQEDKSKAFIVFSSIIKESQDIAMVKAVSKLMLEEPELIGNLTDPEGKVTVKDAKVIPAVITSEHLERAVAFFNHPQIDQADKKVLIEHIAKNSKDQPVCYTFFTSVISGTQSLALKLHTLEVAKDHLVASELFPVYAACIEKNEAASLVKPSEEALIQQIKRLATLDSEFHCKLAIAFFQNPHISPESKEELMNKVAWFSKEKPLSFNFFNAVITGNQSADLKNKAADLLAQNPVILARPECLDLTKKLLNMPRFGAYSESVRIQLAKGLVASLHASQPAYCLELLKWVYDSRVGHNMKIELAIELAAFPHLFALNPGAAEDHRVHILRTLFSKDYILSNIKQDIITAVINRLIEVQGDVAIMLTWLNSRVDAGDEFVFLELTRFFQSWLGSIKQQKPLPCSLNAEAIPPLKAMFDAKYTVIGAKIQHKPLADLVFAISTTMDKGPSHFTLEEGRRSNIMKVDGVRDFSKHTGCLG